mgnify:CR=1 FL=1
MRRCETAGEGAREAVVSLAGVEKSYPPFRLGPVSLRVEPGYVVALVGPNGGGKSTLFRILMGLCRPDSGEVRLFGGRYPEDEARIKRRVGYVPERAVGHDEMDARALGRFLSRWYPGWHAGRYGELLDRLGVERKRPFGRLSKGMQRRLLFAAALSCGPELLLLDEPTGGVDPLARREMIDEISRFARGEEGPGGGRAVIFATHVMEEVGRAADYVAFLHGGRFFGPYEKDRLAESWRRLWVGRPPGAGEAVPGLVAVEQGPPASLLTSSAAQARAALEERGIEVLGARSVPLEEILAHLARGAGASP